jgi:hypothetical protein
MLVGKFSKRLMKGFLEEIEMANNGQGNTRAWWESFAYFDQMFSKNIQEERAKCSSTSVFPLIDL